MRKKKKKANKWSVILTSAADASVKQFHLSKMLVFSVVSLILILPVIITGLTIIMNGIQLEKEDLSQQLAKKEKEMEKMEAEFFHLQANALAVKSSIEEFKELENRLNNLDLNLPIDTNGSEREDGSGGLFINNAVNNNQLISAQTLQMKEELPELIHNFENTVERILAYEKQLRTIPTIMPVNEGRMSSTYGNRKDPFTGITSYHSGIDLAAPLNTPVYATADGVVTEAGRNGGYGKFISINHGEYVTRYGHLNDIDVEVGKQIKKGDQIGKMGTTGRSTGVHLHYEILKNEEFIDPYFYMTFHK
ncbi:M23 family metallopeptidase [Bacillaceae bacterium Marseille-Q3522]|nr:M23 family metallopeptidase [Bacillaceae bacterium Marseille-Q3522]